jgi:hypothetical protein
MDKPKINISYVPFPAHTATDAERASAEFGLKVGQAIEYEWFRKDANAVRYFDQAREFHKRRLYARAEQPIDKYKNEISVDGDLSHVNLDWTPIAVLPKFVDIVVNGMSDRLFKPKAYSQDALSQEGRSKYQDMIEGQMAAKEILSKVKEMTGVDTFVMNEEDLPGSDDELSLHMQLNYKPAIEIAEEEALAALFAENQYDDLRKRIDEDITTIGVGFAKHEFLMGHGVKISYVDPANLVYSYTEDPYFKDCFYFGEVKNVHINELYKINPDITEEKIKEISKMGNAWFDYYASNQVYDNSLFKNDTCSLLFFNYKTVMDVKFKKKILNNGGVRVTAKEDTFNPPAEMLESGGFEVISKKIDVWYEGVLVLGTTHLLKWEAQRNMVRPKSMSQYAIPQYVGCAPRMYKGRIESLTSRMIPFADAIQITHLKIQQLVAKIAPDGVFIDADGINEVDLGTGGSYTPEDALRLYFQTGSVIGRSFTSEGDFNNARIPIQEINTSSGSNKLQMLLAAFNHYLDQIRVVTGLNEARDASTPDPKSLVGLQKLAAANSNTATRHILNAGIYIYRSLAEALSYRVSDILEFSDFKDSFVNRIGKYNVGVLDSIKDLYLYDFGISIEISPDEEERAKLEENIQIALKTNDISLEDAIEVREIKNIKIANQFLKLRRRRKLERDEKMEMQRQAMTAQQQLKSQELAGQVAVQKIQMEGQMKMQVKQHESSLDTEKMKVEAALKLQLMSQEFDYNMQIAGISTDAVKSKEQMKEDAKDKRIDKQSTQQSKLIDQRKNNLPPINFESNEDTLDGFELGEFEPR